MKSTLILISIIGLILISDIHPAFAVADSCLIMVENDDGWTGFNPDSIKVDKCKGSPTYGMWYSKNGYLVQMKIYALSPKPMPKGGLKTWRDIDSQYVSIKAGFQLIEEKYGNFIFKRYDESKDNISKSDSLELLRCIFVINFEKYVLCDSVIANLRKLDSVIFSYLVNDPVYYSVEDEINNNSISISPNPTCYFIEITCKGEVTSPLQSDVRIYDFLGEIQSTPFCSADTPASGGQVRIDVSSLPPGMYFVRFGDRVGKFVKL